MAKINPKNGENCPKKAQKKNPILAKKAKKRVQNGPEKCQIELCQDDKKVTKNVPQKPFKKCR